MALILYTMMILVSLLVKHFVVDFIMQGPYQYLNKGKFGHPGGILHAALHGIATYILFAVIMPSSEWAWALAMGGVDAVTHYFIDWGKVNINKKMGWGPTTSEQFWWLVGFDQLLHQLTYVGILYATVFHLAGKI